MKTKHKYKYTLKEYKKNPARASWVQYGDDLLWLISEVSDDEEIVFPWFIRDAEQKLIVSRTKMPGLDWHACFEVPDDPNDKYELYFLNNRDAFEWLESSLFSGKDTLNVTLERTPQ